MATRRVALVGLGNVVISGTTWPVGWTDLGSNTKGWDADRRLRGARAARVAPA